jgi:hypothetical protein
MSEWCQNKKCPQKKNQNQMRGSKGAKYYQSNKATKLYYGVLVYYMVVVILGLMITRYLYASSRSY